jgi:hypothetical protein
MGLRNRIPGAQTERRGDAGTVRLLLGAETHRPTLFWLCDFCYLTVAFCFSRHSRVFSV